MILPQPRRGSGNPRSTRRSPLAPRPGSYSDVGQHLGLNVRRQIIGRILLLAPMVILNFSRSRQLSQR
jgi:hypothetical protein